MDKKKVVVMFSGGTDSTYAALQQIPNYDEIHLVTFIRHGIKKLENPDIIVERLRKKFPDKEIIYRQINNEDIYRKVTPHAEKWEAHQLILNQEIGPLWEDPHGKRLGRQKYDSDKITLFMTNECLQCKIAMHIAAIRYCKENDISNLCDGGNPEQLDDGSQLEDVKSIAQAIFARFGINYFSPVFHVSAEERGKALFEAGITDHLDHKRLEKAHQIPSTQIQCTVPSSVLWTICIFPWLVYDGQSCNEYIDMCCNYYQYEMENGLETMNLVPEEKKV
ncbi:MAG: hypothetical protein SVW57_06485 [Thermodesulfobacteriota bacterium]|nr:hypothetical protein [Thermodesulfobacteriota bacterium]